MLWDYWLSFNPTVRNATTIAMYLSDDYVAELAGSIKPCSTDVLLSVKPTAN